MHVIITTHWPRTVDVIELESYFLTLILTQGPFRLQSVGDVCPTLNLSSNKVTWTRDWMNTENMQYLSWLWTPDHIQSQQWCGKLQMYQESVDIWRNSMQSMCIPHNQSTWADRGVMIFFPSLTTWLWLWEVVESSGQSHQLDIWLRGEPTPASHFCPPCWCCSCKRFSALGLHAPAPDGIWTQD